jgi:hypothetical protein
VYIYGYQFSRLDYEWIKLLIMKKNILFTLLMTAIFSCQPETGNGIKKDELKKVVAAYYDALAKKDIQKMNTLTTANFILFDEGVIYTNQSAVNAVDQLKPFAVTFTFDSLNIHMDKNDASVYYFREANFIFDGNTKMPVRFLESATFHKEDNKWKLRFLHSSIRK